MVDTLGGAFRKPDVSTFQWPISLAVLHDLAAARLPLRSDVGWSCAWTAFRDDIAARHGPCGMGGAGSAVRVPARPGSPVADSLDLEVCARRACRSFICREPQRAHFGSTRLRVPYG